MTQYQSGKIQVLQIGMCIKYSTQKIQSIPEIYTIQNLQTVFTKVEYTRYREH